MENNMKINASNDSMTSLATTHPILPTYSKNILYLIYIVTFIVGTTTNASVIYIIGVKQRFIKRFDAYIVSLATADFMASFLIPFMTIHNLVTDEKWNFFGDVGCKFFTSIKPFTKMVSATMLVIISIGRLRVIKSNVPISRMKTIRTFIEASFVWILSAVLTVPRAFYFQLHADQCTDPSFKDRYSYYVLVEILLCFLPMLAMGVVYTASGCFILQKNIPNGNARLSTQRRNQYKKMARMFGILVLVFITFTMPHSIVVFIIYGRQNSHGHGIYQKNRELLYLKHAFKVLLSIHYCINPYIYAKMHNSLGKHLRNVKETWYRLKFRLSSENADQRRSNLLTAHAQASKSPSKCADVSQCQSSELEIIKQPVKRNASENSASSFTIFQ